MKVDEAVEEVEKLEEVKDILDGEGFFCSAYLILDKGEEIKEWDLGFYSPEEDKITAVKVTDGGPEIGVTDKPLKKETHKLELDKVEVSAEEALEKAKEEMEEEYSKSYKKILFSLKMEGNPVWSTTFVGSGLSIVSVDVDVGSGEVVKSEKSKVGGPSIGG